MASKPKPGEEPPGSSIEVADPDEYNRSRRLRQVHNAREAFVEEWKEADEAFVSDDIDYNRFEERVVEALIWYIVEVEPIIHARQQRQEKVRERKQREADRKDGEGAAEVPKFADFWAEEAVEGPDGEEFTLERIVENDGVLDPDDEDSNVIPAETSRKAFRLVNRFLSDAGFGLPFDKNLPGHPAETDYKL